MAYRPHAYAMMLRRRKLWREVDRALRSKKNYDARGPTTPAMEAWWSGLLARLNGRISQTYTRRRPGTPPR